MPTSKSPKPRTRSAVRNASTKMPGTYARFSLIPEAAQQNMYATLSGWLPELWEDADGTEVAALAVGLALGPQDAIIHPWAARATVAERLHTGTISAVEAMMAAPKADTKLTALVCAGALEAKSDPRPVLGFAARHKLPIIYLVSNRYPAGKSPHLDLRTLHAEFGIPVFSTDAHDAIAAYRIATESIHNARYGRGPCVIEALSFRPFKLRAQTALSLLADYMERQGNPPRKRR